MRINNQDNLVFDREIKDLHQEALSSRKELHMNMKYGNRQKFPRMFNSNVKHRK